MSFLSLGEVVSTHIALLASYPSIRSLPRRDGIHENPHHDNSPGDNSQGADENIPPSSPWVNSKARRALDFGGASLALLLLSPVMAACWLVVRFSSPGPVFFRQFRAGRNGTEFELYKFRSMRLANSAHRPGHTVYGDSRITAVGAFLRRYKLDEIPQFWNVLKGDMSLVGPRPKLAHHEGLQMPYRPGLTGQATLAFRHEERMLLEVPRDQVEPFYESVVKPIKAWLDIDYMQHATFFSDVSLLWRTFIRCIACSGDAHQELAALVVQHAPDYAFVLQRESGIPRFASQHSAPGFLSDLPDDLVGDLDDAA